MSKGQFHELKSKGSSLADIFPFPKTLVDSTVCADGRKLVKGISAPPASRRLTDGRGSRGEMKEATSRIWSWLRCTWWSELIYMFRRYVPSYMTWSRLMCTDQNLYHIFMISLSGDQTEEQEDIRTWSQNCYSSPNALQCVNPRTRTSPFTRYKISLQCRRGKLCVW